MLAVAVKLDQLLALGHGAEAYSALFFAMFSRHEGIAAYLGHAYVVDCVRGTRMGRLR